MRYAKLGNTGIEVSRICVGGMSFGERSEDFHTWTLDQKETTGMLRTCIDRGVNFIDTANAYSHGTHRRRDQDTPYGRGHRGR